MDSTRLLSHESSVSLLAILTSLVGLGALTVGTFSFINSTLTPQIYGLPALSAPISAAAATATVAVRTENKRQHVLLDQQTTLLHALSARNLFTGIAILAMTAYWQQCEAQDVKSAEVADAVRTCLGLTILAGTIVPVVDGYGAYTLNRKSNLNSNQAGLERMSAVVHFLRFFAWLAAGVWCLSDWDAYPLALTRFIS